MRDGPGSASMRLGRSVRKGQLLITHALLGHYHAELHEAEAPPEDIHCLDEDPVPYPYT